MKKIQNDHPFANEKLIDYDPINGVKTFGSSAGRYGETWAIRHEFDDVSPEVDASRELAKDQDHWKNGVKNSWLHYAHIPDALLLKWHTEGIDINNPSELTRMVNRAEYAYLRCTPKIHVAKQ